MPLEPSGFEFAGGHLPCHDDLKRALAEFQRRDFFGRERQVFIEETIKMIDLPIEFFLEGDHAGEVGCGATAGRLQVLPP